ncbi:piggyBac transposable element-derived protein 4 [Haplochromis burtoni]|uniref:PiggyBac transposable element-derived protein 4-like n=1 Tax=Haplochromis burtoni TaxID=8153 RepID=A0A3Q2V3B5_HAPBU|nr:piggyBac transposable element-derived protein 4 [Haplochromis burtoni]
MARRSYSLLQAPDYVRRSESEDDEESAASVSSENDSISTSDEDYHPVPDSSSSPSENDTKTAVEVERLMEETVGEAADAGAPGAEWMSRSGNIEWFPTAEETMRYNPVPTGITPGPTLYAVTRISTLRSAFDLFVTEEIIQLLCTHTNLHGRRKCENWRDVDDVEMRAYIGLLILAGVYRSRHEASRGLWADKTGRAIFRATMPHYRYAQISANIRFDDKLARPRCFRNDKLAAFRVLWEKWVARLPLLFNPGVDVCVDEQMVGFKGRCGFRQYMPKKPAKYGIKIWVICDVATSYAWKMEIYTGKSGSSREVNQGMRVVLQLTEGLKGHTVTCDNFFTSFSLAEELLRRKVALVGTIRGNKPELPPQLVQLRQRKILSSLFAFTKTTMAVSYMPKQGKNVLLLSTKHREPAVSDGEKKKPAAILDYNKCKGGVDNLDKVVGTYSCRRKTSRWPLTLFYNLLDISAYNGFVLWKAVNPEWESTKTHKRRVFLEELGYMLVTPEIARRPCAPRSKAAAAIVAEIQQSESETESDPKPINKTRKRCELCINRRRTATTCSSCEKSVCKDHSAVVCVSCLP